MKSILVVILSICSLSVFATGNIAKGKAKSATCVACHGATGNSTTDIYPKIAGQSQNYLFKQLKEFKSQVRKDPTMFGMVVALSEDDMSNLAAYYSSQSITPNVAKADKETLAMAEKIYRGGKLETKTTACAACHGVTGAGIPSAQFPAIAFQHSAYITKQLNNFRQASFDAQENKITATTRTNDPASMMRDVTKHLTTKEIGALSQYIAGLH